jgi:hypothetical protein
MQHGPFIDHLPIMVMFHDFPYVKLLEAIWIYYAGWWFGTWLLFFHSVGNFIIPTDDLHHFSEG